MIAVDAVRLLGQANPDFRVRYEGFAPGEGPELFSDEPVVIADAGAESAPVRYALIFQETVSAQNYEIQFAPGVLMVLPAMLNQAIPSELAEACLAAKVNCCRTVLFDGSGGLDFAFDAEDAAAEEEEDFD